MDEDPRRPACIEPHRPLRESEIVDHPHLWEPELSYPWHPGIALTKGVTPTSCMRIGQTRKLLYPPLDIPLRYCNCYTFLKIALFAL